MGATLAQGLIQALSTGIQDALDKMAASAASAPAQGTASDDIRAMLTKTVADQAQAISHLTLQLEAKNIENEALRQRLTAIETRKQAHPTYLEQLHG